MRYSRWMKRGTAWLCLSLAACGNGKPGAASPPAPSKAEPVAHESELLRLTLSADAERQLGISTATAAVGSMPSTLLAHGEILLPAAGGGIPLGTASDLALLASNQALRDGDLLRAQAQFDIAQRNANRAEALVREQAGSERLRDEALAALAVARGDLETAKQQRRQLGPAVAEMNTAALRWVRVSIAATDLARVALQEEVNIQALNAGPQAPVFRALPVSAPPSANAQAGSLDLYYALQGADTALQIGQRVAVSIVQNSAASGLVVPASALLRDINGGEWVYRSLGERRYERRRIEVIRTQGDRVLLSRGLALGDSIVVAGATELFGTEFGTK
jgi:multidrug efflux pump subunit AcrA (membrane-fusion protein)